MKNFLFVVALVLGTVGANASIAEFNGPLGSQLFESEVFQEKTYFETLGEMFTNGKKPDPEKLVGTLWSGRCFFASNPNEPTNAGYIFLKVKGSDVGPIGHNVATYAAVAFFKPSEAPNYFDTMTLDEVIKSGIPSLESIQETLTSLMYQTPTSVEELKLSNKYLIVEARGKSNAGPIASKKVEARCYFFVPEYN